MIIGDYNAKVGMGRREDLIGDFGLGLSNERGDRLFEFCQENDMVIKNTWFKLPKRRLYTWKSPADKNQTPIRKQIDYILINIRYRNCVTRVTTFPGADIGSDHVPLVADIKLKLKSIKPKCRSQHYDITKIEILQFRKQVKEELNKEWMMEKMNDGRDTGLNGKTKTNKK
ncbi:craniofacial development protein 2-like [Centruroides sculpturatus]|uniref:craniofacial development protein 2-like n=1 Tax=Centruroides sculpturatus TaxID=218467 RepID=UPI000C6D14DF|nr:craniofacial development protein 2-like [Centruroides sculpturatus]